MGTIIIIIIIITSYYLTPYYEACPRPQNPNLQCVLLFGGLDLATLFSNRLLFPVFQVDM